MGEPCPICWAHDEQVDERGVLVCPVAAPAPASVPCPCSVPRAGGVFVRDPDCPVHGDVRPDG